MKLWSFIFTDPSWSIVSARVAAKDKIAAHLLLSGSLGIFLEGDHTVICQYAGEVDVEKPRIVSIAPRTQ